MNRVIVIDQGQVVMDGPRDVVLNKLATNDQKQKESATSQPSTSKEQGSSMGQTAPPHGRTIVIKSDQSQTYQNPTNHSQVQKVNME